MCNVAPLSVHGALMTEPDPPRTRPDPVALADARDDLLRCLDKLDDLGLFEAGARVSMAIDAIDRRLVECSSASINDAQLPPSAPPVTAVDESSGKPDPRHSGSNEARSRS